MARQLKLIVLVLVFSNIALGGCGFYFLRAIERKYSALIDQAVPTLNDMQTLTALIIEAMRTTNARLFAESPQGRAVAVARARIALEHDRDLRNSILKREWLTQRNEERVAFQNAGEAFSPAAAEVIGLFESARDAEASKRREESLRPAFEHYIAATTKAADVLEAAKLAYERQIYGKNSQFIQDDAGVGQLAGSDHGHFLDDNSALHHRRIAEGLRVPRRNRVGKKLKR